jgi:AraC-like DNA-binding protein
MLKVLSIQAPTYVSLLWALILLISSKSNKARFFLGIFMFTVFMIFLSHVIYFNHWKEIYIYFDLIFIVGSLSIFPLYYWYIKLLTFQSSIRFKDLKHLIPALVMLIATTITYLLMPKQVRELYVNDYLYGRGKLESAPLLIKIQLILCYTLQAIYLLQIVFSFMKIRTLIARYNKSIANYYSNLDNLTIEWPLIIFYSFVATSVFTILTNFVGRSFFDKWPILLLLTCIAYSVFLFVLGYLGYMQNYSIERQETHETSDPILLNSKVESINQKQIKTQLMELFEKEQIFTQADLKITDIASRLNTNRTYISNLINHEYGCSFSTFVNQYRVEEAKKVMLDEEYCKFCLEHISSHAGFGSLHSFIRVFKEIEGITPGRYRERTKTS